MTGLPVFAVVHDIIPYCNMIYGEKAATLQATLSNFSRKVHRKHQHYRELAPMPAENKDPVATTPAEHAKPVATFKVISHAPKPQLCM